MKIGVDGGQRGGEEMFAFPPQSLILIEQQRVERECQRGGEPFEGDTIAPRERRGARCGHHQHADGAITGDQRYHEAPVIGQQGLAHGWGDFAQARQLAGPTIVSKSRFAAFASGTMPAQHIERPAGGDVFNHAVAGARDTDGLADGWHEAIEHAQQSCAVGHIHGVERDAGEFGGTFGALPLEFLQREQP
jgi:hypothetical protein